MSFGRHMKDDEIEQYSMREMSEAESASLEEHVLTCEDCRNRVVETEIFISAMCQAGNQIRGASPGRPVWSWVFAGASVAAVVLTATFLIRAPQPAGFQEAHLYAMRGAAVGAKVTAGHPLLLVPDLTGLPAFPSYRLQLVDLAGKPLFTGAVTAQDPVMKVDRIPPGIYFVRLSSPAGELLREYGLESGR
jgi:putative zinc finger protein